LACKENAHPTWKQALQVVGNPWPVKRTYVPILRYIFKTFQNLYYFKTYIISKKSMSTKMFFEMTLFFFNWIFFFGNHIIFTKKINSFYFSKTYVISINIKVLFFNDTIFAKKKNCGFSFFLNLHHTWTFFFLKWKFWKEAS
jgi:hypothetical protein